ncbi:MAG: efflux RND transporter permease subunit [Xenococcaceae cyanobacterium]
MSKLFYRNVRLLILTIAIILIWGFSSFQALPRLEDPELVSRVALVKTFWTGADAQRMEALVTEKIEEKIAEIEEVDNYQSTSQSGSSIVTVELVDRIKKSEVDLVWSRLRDKLREIRQELPSGATDPELEEVEVRAYALITALTWYGNNSPNYAILDRKAKSLEDELRAIDGTEKVEVFGAPDEEITLEVNSAELAALGLTTQELSRQIQQSDSKIAAGQLRGSDNDLLIEVKGELDSLERIRQIPIRCNDCNSQSQFTRLGDIAKIEKGIVTPPNQLAIVSGKPGVSVAVFVESEKRLDRWAKDARKILSEFEKELPSSIKLRILLEQNSYVEARLNNLISNLFFGAILLFFVTIFMMGWQSAVVIQTALPLSIAIVFVCMSSLGIPLHQMSVTGLIVALDILIDNAIIVVDEVQNRLKDGLKPKDAIAQTVNYLLVPSIGANLTTIIGFLPIALLPGSVGEFVGAIGTNVILAVAASFLVAMTIIPVLAVRLHQYFLQKGTGNGERGTVITSNNKSQVNVLIGWWRNGFSSPVLTRIYRRSLNWTLRRPIVGILICSIVPVFGFLVATTFEIQFFPAADRDQIQIQLELPASSSLQQTQSLVKHVGDRFKQYPEVADIHWFVGESAPRFYYNVVGNRERDANYAHALLQMKSVASNAIVMKMQTDMDKIFPSARVLVRQLEQGPPFDAPIELRIYGNDIDRLQQLGEQARTLLANTDRVTHTRASLNDVLPQIAFRPDEEESRLAKLDRAQIAQQLETSLEGTTGGSVLESTEELPVRVRLSHRDRSGIDRINSIDLLANTPNSDIENSLNSVPLSALGKIAIEPELSSITRRNGERLNLIQGFIRSGSLPANVLQDFQQQLNANLQLPSGYSLEFGGENEERSDAVGKLFGFIGVLVVLMVATLVLSLGSFQLAALMGAIAIFSVGLSFLAIWLFGYPFGFNPIIGTIGAIGVVVNDAISILAAIKDDSIAKTGDKKAVTEVVIHSTRHVLTTTFTSVFGFIPLILGGGGFWPPLAVAIAGGVCGATLLALYFIPSAYIVIAKGKFRAIEKQKQQLA